MNIILKDADTFRRIINCLKDLVTDSGELVFNSKGINMQSTDTAKVVMIDILLEQDAFIKYDLENELEELKLSFNFINFNDVLKLSKSTQIGMIYKAGADKVTLKLNENSTKKVQFNMSLSSSDKEQLEISDIEYDVKVYIDSTELQKSIKDLSSFGKKCNITVSENEVILSVTGDIGDGEVCISDAEIEYSESIDESEKITGLFNMKYLNFFAKAGLSNEIIMKFCNNNNIPFCFEYQLEYGYVKFYMSQMQLGD